MKRSLRTRETGFAVVWSEVPARGKLAATNGTVGRLRIAAGTGSVSSQSFSFTSAGPGRIECGVSGAIAGPGAGATLVTLEAGAHTFSFFLRDVSRANPIFIPDYHAIVTAIDDRRSYRQIAGAIRRRRRLTDIQRMEAGPEENFATAAAATRSQAVPTWLGVGRDMRIFEVGFPRENELWFWITPKFGGCAVATQPDRLDVPLRYHFFLGRGIGCVPTVTRRLEDGCLPILLLTVRDNDITYDCTAFVTLESSPLTAADLRGTHFLVADSYGCGNMQTAKQKQQRDTLQPAEIQRSEETVLFLLAQVTNTSDTPRYAWIKNVFRAPQNWFTGNPHSYSGSTGFAATPEGRVFAISRWNDRPLPQEETAILLAPGESASLELRVFHQPVTPERAERLATQKFEVRHRECRAFWKSRLNEAASISLPDPVIDEKVRAGQLHLDLVAYGLEPAGTVAPFIGVYCPIGSESAPIIQFFDSLGRHSLAERCLDYFLEKQHPDGFIQNFSNYMLETGAALWSMGEHYRYTHDEQWLRRVTPRLLLACDYLTAWRKRNLREELRGKGYGMIDGKCADPEDPFHAFMLNGYAYIGLRRVAEMLAESLPDRSAEIAREARGLLGDIRAALRQAMARSPLVPMADGTWTPTAPPWAEGAGPSSLHVEAGDCFTHGSAVARDSMLGPLWLVIQEVLDAREPIAGQLINYHAELMHQRNVALSQPYYSRHDWVHLKRGEVGSFLKYYYNCVASLADRETHTFWEHFFHASVHKTHEEGWFLMQTRWMLWLEEGSRLNLLPGIPRAWLEDGRVIELRNAASYFGPFSLRVESKLKRNLVEASIRCVSSRKPESVTLRIPHPKGKKAVRVTGGKYDPASETVLIEHFSGRARCTITFGKK